MELIKVLSFFLLGLTSFIFFLKKKDSLNDLIILLLSTAAILLVSQDISEPNNADMISNSLILFLSLNFLVSRIKKLQLIKLSWLLPIFLVFGCLFFIQDTIQYNGYDFKLSNLSILLLPVFGALAYPIARFKSEFLSKAIGIDNTENLTHVVLVFFIGFSAFIGSFFASNFGILLIALGYIGASFYRNVGYKNVGISLLLLSLIYYFQNLVSLESVNLSFGKTLEGIFFGGFTVLFLQVLSSAKKHTTLFLSLGLALCIFLIYGLLFLFTQKSDFGGMDAFIGVLVGISITIALFPNFKLAEMLFSFVIAGGMLIGPMIINEAELNMTQIKVSTSDNITNESIETSLSPFDIKGLSIDSLKGSYKINEKTAQLNFNLGPKGGITKGAFKTIRGKINIASTIENSTFSVEIPVNQLTTFNKYRDESLMDEAYFNVNKFPKITYNSSQLIKNGDGYILKGNLTMLGVSKALDINIKYIGRFDSEDENYPVLIGRSTIDRTLFGMKPDSKEGNSVDFEFKVELIKD